MLVFICREGGNVFCVKEEGYLLLGISTLLLLLWIVVKLALISRKTSMFNTADTHHLLFLVRLSFTWQFKKKNAGSENGLDLCLLNVVAPSLTFSDLNILIGV